MRPYCTNPWVEEKFRKVINLEYVIRAEPDYEPFYGGVGGKNPLIRITFCDGETEEYWMPSDRGPGKEQLEKEWKRFYDEFMSI